MGCIDVDVDVNIKQDDPSITATGPAHSGDISLADADIWLVPPLSGDDAIVWTLLHPDAPATAVVQRTCSATAEPFLWLSDPPDWSGSGALATFNGCGEPGKFYSTVELTFDGTQWVGVSASGAATILPPK